MSSSTVHKICSYCCINVFHAKCLCGNTCYQIHIAWKSYNVLWLFACVLSHVNHLLCSHQVQASLADSQLWSNPKMNYITNVEITCYGTFYIALWYLMQIQYHLALKYDILHRSVALFLLCYLLFFKVIFKLLLIIYFDC